MNVFQQKFVEIARRFLQTAIVVDDRPYWGAGPVVGKLKPPPRRRSDRDDGTQGGGKDAFGGDVHDLDAERLIGGFAGAGLLCGVVSAVHAKQGGRQEDVIDRADIVILDWQIEQDDGTFAMAQLKRMRNQARLRLAIVYTGEWDLHGIAERITHLDDSEPGRWEKTPSGLLRNGSFFVALYCKPDTKPAHEFRNRVIGEERLATKVVDDFAVSIAGLLPAIVLTAFGAMRDSTYRLLACFDGRLDPAFLTHRACSLTPEDAEAFIVSKLAAEIASLLGDAVAAEQPAGWQMIAAWLNANSAKVADSGNFEAMIKDGVKVPAKVDGITGKKRDAERRYGWFTKKLLSGDCKADGIDKELAWLASHRLVIDERKRLHLGVVVHERVSNKYMVCITPRCDSVRLTAEKRFLFLELKDGDGKWKMVVKGSGKDFLVKTIDREPLTRTFRPEPDADCTVCAQQDASGRHWFVDVRGIEYDWLGELRLEFAQRLAQRMGSHLARVPAEETEWLRGKERKG